MTIITKESQTRRLGKKPKSRTAATGVPGRRVVHRTPKPQKLSRTQLRNRCDELCSKIVRLREGQCARCGTFDWLQWSHHVSRAYLITRYLYINACAHCRSCHVYFTNHPLEHRQWIKQHIGETTFAFLETLALWGTENRYRPDYDAIRAGLTKTLAELEAV